MKAVDAHLGFALATGHACGRDASSFIRCRRPFICRGRRRSAGCIDLGNQAAQAVGIGVRHGKCGDSKLSYLSGNPGSLLVQAVSMGDVDSRVHSQRSGGERVRRAEGSCMREPRGVDGAPSQEARRGGSAVDSTGRMPSRGPLSSCFVFSSVLWCGVVWCCVVLCCDLSDESEPGERIDELRGLWRMAALDRVGCAAHPASISSIVSRRFSLQCLQGGSGVYLQRRFRSWPALGYASDGRV
jgi:hypothetical protein